LYSAVQLDEAFAYFTIPLTAGGHVPHNHRRAQHIARVIVEENNGELNVYASPVFPDSSPSQGFLHVITVCNTMSHRFLVRFRMALPLALRDGGDDEVERLPFIRSWLPNTHPHYNPSGVCRSAGGFSLPRSFQQCLPLILNNSQQFVYLLVGEHFQPV
jgi:hypothetical protein